MRTGFYTHIPGYLLKMKKEYGNLRIFRRQQMKKSEYFLISFCTFLWLFTSGCVQYIARYDGLYEGKIVDAETRVPIEGVVVLGVWYKEAPTVAGAVSSY